MSSENGDEASPLGELEVRGQQPEHTERARGNTQPSDKHSQEGSQEDLGEESGSSAHRKTQEVTSDRQVQEEDRRTCPEETQERSVRSPKQETDSQDGGPGVCGERWDVILDFKVISEAKLLTLSQQFRTYFTQLSQREVTIDLSKIGFRRLLIS